MNDYEHHIYMQDEMFPDWRKYWNLSVIDGKYVYTKKQKVK